MSQLTKIRDTRIKAVCRYCRCNIHPSFNGCLIEGDDRYTFVEASIHWCLVLCDILSESSLESIQYIARFLSRDLYEISRDITFVCDTAQLVMNGDLSCLGFKHLVYDNQTNVILQPLFDMFLSGDELNYPELVRMYRWFSYLKTLNLHIDLQTSTVSAYITSNGLRHNYVYPDDIIDLVETCIFEKFSNYTSDGFMPKHGPGVTSEVSGKDLSVYNKYTKMHTDPLLDYYIRKSNFSEYLPRMTGVLDRTSRLICVPKSLTKNRVISAEPTSLQFFQQREKDALYDWIHRAIGHHVHMKDQVVNRDAARIGSIVGDLTTIDLSSASDDVTFALVKKLFRRCPRLRLAAYTLRSREVLLPSGEKIVNASFAPMGSALCFPIECIVFWGIVEAAARMSGQYHLYKDFLVYGDDIVCHTDLALLVIELLSQLNFTVNKSKTFTGYNVTSFRESCGGFFFNGQDITPLKISRRFRVLRKETERMTPSLYESLVDLHNRATDYSYMTLRRYVYLSLDRIFGRFSLVFGQGKLLSVDGQVSRWRDRKRYNHDLFYLETYNISVKTEDCFYGDIDADLLEEFYLYEWFLYAFSDPKIREPVRTLVAKQVVLDWSYSYIKEYS